LHQEELRAARVLARAVGELAGQRGTAGDTLAHHALRRFGALLGVGDRELCDALSRIGVAVQPERDGVTREALEQSGGIARGQPLLHLAGELRLVDLPRKHVPRLVPDVLRGELDAARHEIANFTELAYGLR